MKATTGSIPADTNKTFKPGERWLDTDGVPINAHGGGILFKDGVYYWYGECKKGETRKVGVNSYRMDVVGISCYSSTDLLNWKNEGLVIEASDDPKSDFHPSQTVERPKVIFNEKTGKYVMWMHLDGKVGDWLYGKASSGVAISDSPTGPFTHLHTVRPHAGIWPENFSEEASLKQPQCDAAEILKRDFEKGQCARDMTLFVDDDGRAYHIYSSEENMTLHIALLTDDYQQHAGKYQRFFIGRYMEAPALFKHKGRYHLMASGCTAWDPNAARSAVADSIWGPWKELDNPAIGEDADKTFYTQSTFILPVQGQEDTFIYMGDRWIKEDLEDSRYVWLPIELTETGFQIKWTDEWTVS